MSDSHTCSYCQGKGYDVKDRPGTSKACPQCGGDGQSPLAKQLQQENRRKR
jgi:DnaJ-class molecular chaperone